MMKIGSDSTSPATTRLQAKIVATTALSEMDKAQMFALMRKYYNDVHRDLFLADLAKKGDVILLFTGDRQTLAGFSTLVTVIVKQNNREYRGIFSGDTVIEKAFWGQRALGKAFLRYLLRKRLAHPLKPLYWLLISKGYKTYLMMANNFVTYYPRYDEPTPPAPKALMDAFYKALYGEAYDSERGLITPACQAGHVKAGVAAITKDLLEGNPRIAFFQEANPDWDKGVELACLARMTWWLPLQYAVKALVVDGLVKPLRDLPVAILGSPWKRENRKR